MDTPSLHQEIHVPRYCDHDGIFHSCILEDVLDRTVSNIGEARHEILVWHHKAYAVIPICVRLTIVLMILHQNTACRHGARIDLLNNEGFDFSFLLRMISKSPRSNKARVDNVKVALLYLLSIIGNAFVVHC